LQIVYVLVKKSKPESLVNLLYCICSLFNDQSDK